MARTKTTEMSTITAAQLADGDWVPVVDVSDTTMSSTGTNKKLAKSQLAEAAGVTAHLADTSDAHDASAISFSATGNIAATDVQAAIAELDTEKADKVAVQTAEAQRVVALEIDTYTSGHGPFTIATDSFLNTDATYNHLLSFGWNTAAPYEGASAPATPSIWMGLEDNYYDGTGDGDHGSEWYVQHNSRDKGATISLFRPFYCRIKNDVNATRKANIQFDIGTDSGGVMSIFAGKENPALLSVTPSAFTFQKSVTVQGASATFSLSPTTGQPLLAINRHTGGGPTLQFQFSGVGAWSFLALSNTVLWLYDKDVRTNVTFTYGATVNAAVADFATSVKVQGGIGFYGTTPVTTKPTVSGSRGSNAALASLLTALASLGLVTDSSS